MAIQIWIGGQRDFLDALELIPRGKPSCSRIIIPRSEVIEASFFVKEFAHIEVVDLGLFCLCSAEAICTVAEGVKGQDVFNALIGFDGEPGAALPILQSKQAACTIALPNQITHSIRRVDVCGFLPDSAVNPHPALHDLAVGACRVDEVLGFGGGRSFFGGFADSSAFGVEPVGDDLVVGLIVDSGQPVGAVPGVLDRPLWGLFLGQVAVGVVWSFNETFGFGCHFMYRTECL